MSTPDFEVYQIPDENDETTRVVERLTAHFAGSQVIHKAAAGSGSVKRYRGCPEIVATDDEFDAGAAQVVHPCGDQSYAWHGPNGPILPA